MKRSHLPCAVLALGMVSTLRVSGQVSAVGRDTTAATSVATARDAAACLQYATGEWQRHYDAAITRNIKRSDSLMRAADAAVARVARECVLRFPLENASPASLRTMLDLYFHANLRASIHVPARLYVQHAATDAARAEALAYAVFSIRPRSTDSPETAGRMAEVADSFSAQLDALGSRFVKEQFGVHRTLASVYGSTVDDPVKRFAHLAWMLNVITALSPEERKKRPLWISATYTQLADYYSTKGQAAEAKAILAQGFKDSANLDEQTLRDFRSAALIDNPAPPLVASNWLNVPEGTTEIDPKGKVTLVMLTAHW
jgi:hypothetical protein